MRWRSLLAQMVFALTLPIAFADVWAQPQDITGVWRDETANNDDATTPEKIVLPKKPAMINNFHGTYVSKPYLLIQRQNIQDPQSPLFLYSDVGDLRVELKAPSVTPPPGTPIDYDMVDRHPGTTKGKTIGTLRMDAPACNGRPACFTLKAATADLGFNPGPDDLPVLYTPVGIYDPSNDQALDQTFGNMFSPLSANFSYILKCWNLDKMNPIDYQMPGCGQNVFTMPDNKSFGYRKVGFANWHNAAIPFGWTYVSTLFQNGEDHGQTWENGQDVADADSLKIGVGASLNVFGVSASTHVSVGVQHKVQKMYDSKLTFAKAEYLSTQFALVLHKFYAAPFLDQSFVDRVIFIQSLKESARAQEYDRFVSDFGTHYANAITFGSKGERVLQMTQKQVVDMHEKQVDVSAGLTAGYMGNGASVDVDSSKSNMEKLTNNTSREDRQWFCYSGGACNDGIPSGDAVLPVQLDLRPISDLLAPPFFADDEIITTMRDGISQAIARAAFVERNNLSVPTAVFATVTGLDRYNITAITAQGPQVDTQPCGGATLCFDGAVTLTSTDDPTVVTVLGSSGPLPSTWTTPATLDLTKFPDNHARGYVTANSTWKGSCPHTASTWENKDSVDAVVTYPDLMIVKDGAGGGVVVPAQSASGPLRNQSSSGQVAVLQNTLFTGLAFVESPNCGTNDNPTGLITARKDRTITKVRSASQLFEK